MPRIFSEEDRKIIHSKLINIGLDSLRTKGYREISLDDVTAKAGIAKGTFYNFFPSKERYFYEIMQKIKEDNRVELRELLAEGMPKKEKLEAYFYKRYTCNNTVYSYFTAEEISRIMRTIPQDDPDNDSVEFARDLLVSLEERKTDFKPEVVVNLCNVLALASTNQDLLEKTGYEETIRVLVKALADYLYG